MQKRKMASLSAAFLLGMAAASYRFWPLWCILAAFGAAWAYSVRRDGQRRILAPAFFLAALLGAFHAHGHEAARAAYEPWLVDGTACLLQGEVCQREVKGDEALYRVKNCVLQLGKKQYSCNHVLFDLSAEEHFIGEILCIEGTIKTFSRPRNEGNFDERGYYQSLNIDFRVEDANVISVHGKKDAWKEALLWLRERMKESLARAMPKEDAGVLCAMILGEKGLIGKERKQAYQDAGISHFYSISGLHISLLGMAAYRLLRKFGCGYALSGGIAAPLLLLYGQLTGFGVSLGRAVGMFLLLLYAKCRGRSYDRLTALAVMAAALAGENPGLLRHAGFLLSFGAVLGVCLAQWVLEREGGAEEGGGGWGRKVKEAVWVSLCIQLTTVPVLCQFFYGLSLYAVFINFIVLPFMGALLGMGIVGAALGCFFPFAGTLLLFPCHLILLLFDAACSVFLSLPNAVWVTGALSAWAVLAWYGVLCLFASLKGADGRRGLPVLARAALAPLLLGILAFPKGGGAFELDVLDVGQGDGIFFSMGDGTSAFLDGGSTDVPKVGEYRILPFLKYRGVRRIDYWFVSHCDADHVSGLREALEAGYPIQNLAVSRYMPQDEAWGALRALAEEKGVRILSMGYGDAVKGQGWSVECRSVKAVGDGQDRNENSLALLVSCGGFSGFFAGDAGELAERELVENGGLKEVDVYKASHHGSNTSNGDAILKKLRPKLTVISCGMKNRYGHPGADALDRMERAGSRIYETRHRGQVKFRVEGGARSMLK